MPRFLIERTFPDGLTIPTNKEGSIGVCGVVDNSAGAGDLGAQLCVARSYQDLLHL